MKGVRLEDVRRAYEARDPSLPELVVALAQTPNLPDDAPEGVLTYNRFIAELRSWSFSYKTDEEKQQYRQTSWTQLEANPEESLMPDRLMLHEIVWMLWQSQGAYERECLLQIIATCPLQWGPWRALKRIFKEAEQQADIEMMGAMAARLDGNAGNSWGQDVSGSTIGYMKRRAWRFLRRAGVSFPTAYADYAVEVLRFYTDDSNFNGSWVANHIMFHERGGYGTSFYVWTNNSTSLIKDRAFDEAWKRTPRPLFSLLERANSERARKFAVEGLKTDFKTVLREVEPAWVARLANVHSATAHEFVIWLLQNVPKFEQASFRTMGLHDAILSLFNSPASTARTYAAAYARTYARDLPLDDIILLTNNSNDDVRGLAFDLLRDFDPRNDVGLERWGKMLGTTHGHTLAMEMLSTHFGPGELDADWFSSRLLSDESKVVVFAINQLLKVHSPRKLGKDFFASLFEDARLQSKAADFALKTMLKSFTGSDIDFKRLLLHPLATVKIREHISGGKFSASRIDVAFWKALAHEATWNESQWVQALTREDALWATQVSFAQAPTSFARDMLSDVRLFKPQDIGFDWLFELVSSMNSDTSGFARRYMLSALKPSDFAPDGTPEASRLQEGSQRLWDWATEEVATASPTQNFAVDFIKQRHPQMGPDLLDRELTPGMAMDASFFSFERIQPLLLSEHHRLRALVLEISKWELAGWSPSLREIVSLCEDGASEVTAFFEKALLSPELPEHRTYRLGRDQLTIEGVYRFCESSDQDTRRIGMALIAMYDDLAQPKALFRLTQSPDRQLRAFVVRELWALYRKRGVTQTWSPTSVDFQYTASKNKPNPSETGQGLRARPDGFPVKENELREFLRRELFVVPPAKRSRKEAASDDASADASSADQDTQVNRHKPVAARRAKLALIEVVRDLAVDDEGFATYISPLFIEFMDSKGKSEREACLVALVRINHAHPSLNLWSQTKEAR